jgi:peptide deformylase
MTLTKDSIITLPNPHLRQRSKKVGVINEDVHKLADDMIAATLDWEKSREHELGVALAAVQIDELLRMIVIRNNFDDKDDLSFKVFINPVITKYEGALIEDMEGCLSVPFIYGKVKRYEKIRLKALSLEGQEIRLSVDGFAARIVQHEVDHTNGKLFIDHIKGDKDSFFKLNSRGELEELDYAKEVRDNSILW